MYMYNSIIHTIYGNTNLYFTVSTVYSYGIEIIYVIRVIDAAIDYNILYYVITRADRFTRSKRFSLTVVYYIQSDIRNVYTSTSTCGIYY